jgi:glucan biosynthesis protein
MKKLFTLLLILPFLSFIPMNHKDKFVGKWKADDGKEVGYLNFESNGIAFIEVNGQILGGKEFNMNGKIMNMTYEANFETNPIELDIIVTRIENGEQKKLLCIADFINDNTMKFAIDFEGKKLTKFTDENTVVFKKVE